MENGNTKEFIQGCSNNVKSESSIENTYICYVRTGCTKE